MGRFTRWILPLPPFVVIPVTVFMIGSTILTTSALTRVTHHHQPLPAFVSASPAVLAESTTSPTPGPTPEPTPAAQSTTRAKGSTGGSTGGMFGIASGSSLPKLSAAELTGQLTAIKNLGATWVRYDVEWSQVEAAGRGQRNWSDTDRVVRAVQSAGLKSLVVIDYTPAWARPGNCGNDKCAPANPADYAAFAAAVVDRYRANGVSAWEIWNEPNSAAFFQPTANANTYVSLLRAAYPAIKAIQPQSVVLTGGTSPADSDGSNLAPTDFLTAVYQAGGRGNFDAVGHHPYSYPFTAANAFPGSAWSQITSMHNIMAANGDGAKAMWLTEYGAPTGGPDPLAQVGQWPLQGGTPVSEALQSAMVTSAVNALARMPWVQHFFYYSLKDAGTTSDTVENFFGLLRADGSTKPAYGAYQSAIRGWR